LSFILKWSAIASSSVTFCAGIALSVSAQSTPPPGTTIPAPSNNPIDQVQPKPAETPQPLPTTRPPTSAPPPSLDIPPGNPLPLEVPPSSSATFCIKKVEVLGSTVLQIEIKGIIAGYEQGKEPNCKATFETLLEIRSKITQLYVENGYVTSGAFLPNNQSFKQGIVRIQVVEGELERIEISGLRHLRDAYVRQRLERATQTPLNQRRLEEALQLLQLDPVIAQVNAQLTAGNAPGRNILQINLQEAPAFHAGIAIDNSQSPSIGSIQGSIFVEHDNLLGFGDRFSVTYGKTDGLNLYDLSYTIPFNPRNGTFNLRFNNNNSQIIEAPFEDLGIRSESKTFSIGFRQPLVRSPQSEFALGLSLDLRRSQTFLLDDIPFSFSEGPNEGESKVTVLRFSQDWVQRGARQVLAARSQFSLGINAFDATINDTGTDARFFAWLGQFQWVQQLSPRLLLVAQLAAQLTPDSLLPLEQFSLGGINTVRGYRENQLVSDNGILGSLELRFPLTYNPQILQITPFFAVGSGWNNQRANPDPQTIASIGLGVRWQISTALSLRLDYGIPLVDVVNQGDSLQDQGFSFSLRYQPF